MYFKTVSDFPNGSDGKWSIGSCLVQLFPKVADVKADSVALTARGNISPYLLVDLAVCKDTRRPLQYTTVKHKVLQLILKEDLRDDDGKLFKFNTHMFRRSYGVKLTELHLDDWTIAKLLGHKNVSAVKHYRKMSNQLLADETRRARAEQTRILLKNLDGWGEDYEQIRQNG
ncbi:tyrosine-type recombinase/integrase [Mediterraneibacter glycyrrhizinilyticus]|nr:tyrosine-type recombinase/integrase [Mediterraneibacter glycyrrhizinilyticus]